MTLYYGICYDEADASSVDVAKTERDRLESILKSVGHTKVIGRPDVTVIHTDIIDSIRDCIVESTPEGHGEFTVVNGDMTRHGREISFRETVEMYHKDICRGDFDALCKYEGMYSSIHYDSKKRCCLVTTGKLGIRPVYIAQSGPVVVFANALWLIDRSSIVQKSCNIQALSEDYHFFGMLEDRTAYRTVQRLEPGTVASITKREVGKRRYYRLHARPPASGQSLEEAIAETFKQGIRERLRRGSVCYSGLSGGLDSRSIVGVLKEQGADVVTVAFGYEGELDLVLSSKFAALVGAEHHAITTEALYRPNWTMLMRNALSELATKTNTLPPDLCAFWSGDNGSVSLGYLYMRRKLFEHLAQHGESGAIQVSGIESRRLPRRLFKPGFADIFEKLAIQGLITCLENIPISDIRKRWYVFVHENRIHRMLDEHFETIHEHKMEMIAPFLDARLLELVLAGEGERDCEHRLYQRVLEHLPASISEVPWQAYPGHKPCPHPVDTEKSQWISRHTSELKKKHYKNLFMGYAESLLDDGRFPDEIFRRKAFALYYNMYKFLNRDCEYIIYALYKIRSASRGATL